MSITYDEILTVGFACAPRSQANGMRDPEGSARKHPKPLQAANAKS